MLRLQPPAPWLASVFFSVFSVLPFSAGAQFLPPGTINPGADIDGGEDIQVDHLVTSDGVFHAVWASNTDFTGTAGGDPDLFYSRNTGSGWSFPILVNSYGTADNGLANDDREPRLALDGSGVLHCVWQSTAAVSMTGSDWDVFYATFDGNVWGAAVPAAGATGDAVDDILPTVVGLAGGGVLVAWESEGAGGDRDVVWSAVGGDFWTVPAEIAQGAETGDDLGPVALAVDADGAVIAAWSTDDPVVGLGADRDIVMAERPAGGEWSSMHEVSALARTDSGDDRNPAIAVVGRGLDREIHVVWSSDEPLLASGTDRDLLHAIFLAFSVVPPINATFLVNSNATMDNGDDVSPSLCVEPGGTVHVVWQTADAVVGDQDVLHSTNATSGGAWSPFDLLGVNGFFDQLGDDDTRPDIACSSRGFVSGAWQSNDDVGGILGPDHDVFHALATDRLFERPDSVRQDADDDLGTDRQVDAALDADGRLHIVWASDDPDLGSDVGSDDDLFYSVLENGTYSTPELVNVNGTGSESGIDGWPSLVVDVAGTVHVAWASDAPIGGSGTDFDIFYAHREPGGWTTPDLVNTSGLTDGADPGADDLAPHLLLASDQTLQILWSSNVRTGPPMADLSWAQRLASTWSTEELANSSWAGLGYTPYFCAALDLDDDPQVVWASDYDPGGLGSDLDLLFTTRTSGTWSTPLALFDPFTDGATVDGACSLAFDVPDGELWLVWASDFNASGSGSDWDLWVGSRAALTGSWVRHGVLLTLGRDDSSAADDDRPRLVPVEEQLAVVWESTENLGFTAGTDSDLFYALIDPAAGFPSSATVRLANASGHADQGAQDVLGGVALSPQGDLHVVWSSNDDLGGTIGSDADILHSSLRLEVSLVFQDGFESGDTSAWSASVGSI